VCLAVRRLTERPRQRALWCAVALLWAVGVGATRVYLGVHWPTDVIAGWLLAGCLTLASTSRPWRRTACVPERHGSAEVAQKGSAPGAGRPEFGQPGGPVRFQSEQSFQRCVGDSVQVLALAAG